MLSALFVRGKVDIVILGNLQYAYSSRSERFLRLIPSTVIGGAVGCDQDPVTIFACRDRVLRSWGAFLVC